MRRIPSLSAGVVALSALLAACGGGGGGGSSTSPTPPPSTPGPIVASPNPLTLGASASDSNHIVAVSFSQSNATGQLVSAALTGCSGYVTTTQPYDFNQNLSNGSLTATFSSYIGVAPIAQGTCTIVVTPASGATLTIPVIVTP